MCLKGNRSPSGTSPAEQVAVAEFREYLSRRLANAVEVLYEEVPREVWPRVASRLEAVGLQPLMSDLLRSR